MAVPTHGPTQPFAFCRRASPTTGALERAAELWNNGCSSGTYTPSICIGNWGSGCLQIEAYFSHGRSDLPQGACGSYVSYGDGTGYMTIFEKDGNGVPCDEVWGYVAVIQHEVGHMLGLGQAEDPTGACAGHVMGAPTYPLAEYPINPDDCDAVDPNWNTSIEILNRQCSLSCAVPCTNGVCPPEGWGWTECSPCTPLVLDLDGDGIRTTGADDPVVFDIDADGVPDKMGWLARNDDDAFLWRDVEKNHRVDDGSELFGSGTTKPDGKRAMNGFDALAAYDKTEYGGDGDGWITASDAVWPRLRLWIDRNHNGVSEKSELIPMQSSHVVGLGLTWAASSEVDASGNEHRMKGTYRYRNNNGGPHSSELRALVDVYFRRVK